MTSKFAQTIQIADGSSVQVRHGLGTRDVVVALWRERDGVNLEFGLEATDDDTIAISAGRGVGDEAIRVVVIG